MDSQRQKIGLLKTDKKPGHEVIQFFHAQLNIKFIMLINVKMPTIVGILTFISMINTTNESLKARKSLLLNISVI